MKKVLSIILTAVLMLTALPLGPFDLIVGAEDEYETQLPENDIVYAGDFWYIYTRSTNTAQIASVDFGVHFVIPEVLDGYRVTSIGSRAFSHCSDLKSVLIPKSVTYIGDNAFGYGLNLEGVWYQGSEKDRDNIIIGSGNSGLINATWHYNCCTNTHTYSADCDITCNICKWPRKTDVEHTYNMCDANCKKCDYVRAEVPHFVGESLPHILSNSKTYPFSFSNGWYSSTNKLDSSSSTFTLTATHTCSLVVKYKVSSEEYGDNFIISNNGATLVTVSGTVSETSFVIDLVKDDILTFRYEKDYSFSAETDTASFKIEESPLHGVNAELLEPDCKTPIICSGCGVIVKPVSTVHTYDNACDTVCNVCEYTRSVPDHIFADSCDTDCNICGHTRGITHTYDNNCDTVCNVCGHVRKITHLYDNTCDVNCNICGYTREITHIYDNNCDTVCNVCGYVRTITHTYDNACDTICSVCGVIRTVPNHSYVLNGNHTCDICMFSKTPEAPVIESKTNNSVKLIRTKGFEYSKDGTTWQTSNLFEGLLPNTTYTFYQRVKASSTALVSDISKGVTVTFKSAQELVPPAPIISSFTDVTVTLIPNANCEYSFDGVKWQKSNVFEGLLSGRQYAFYQRYAETDIYEASDKSVGVIITTDKSKQLLVPNAPIVESFTSSSITLVAVGGCEYSKNGTTWQSSNVFSGLDCGTKYTFYQRYKETDTTYAGKSSVALVTKTDKGTQTAPSAPALESKTHNTVTLRAKSGYEYSRDGINWQSSNVFTGLDAETNYMFYCRKAETETHYASEPSKYLIVKTNEQPTYTPGDINDSGDVTLDDVVSLAQIVAGWQGVAYNEAALDVNRDGSVTLDDVVLLAQFVAGWGVTLS